MNRGRAQHNPRSAALDPLIHPKHGADAAGHLNGNVHGLDDLGDQVGIVGFAPVHRVKINDMQPFGALGLKPLGDFHGAVFIDHRLIHLAAHQVDATAVLQLNIRKNDHGCGSVIITTCPSGRAICPLPDPGKSIAHFQCGSHKGLSLSAMH